MEAKKTTLADIGYLIGRLTEALDTFNSQVNDDKIVYLDYEPPKKKARVQNSKIMLTDRDLLLEALREIRNLKEQVSEITLLFKPSEIKRSRKQIDQDRISKRVAELERDMLTKKMNKLTQY